MNVLAVRTEYAMRGEAHHSSDIQWAVVYSEDDHGLAEPCYLRTVFVRTVNDVFDVVEHCSPRTQTVGLAVDSRGESLADALPREALSAARPSARCGFTMCAMGRPFCDGPDGAVGKQVIVAPATRM